MELKLGYKRTECGVIPEDWDVKPLATVADKVMVGIASAATHAYRAKGVPMFRNQNIKPGHLDDEDLLFIAPEYEFNFKNKRLRAGDLLTMRTGYPGVTAIVPCCYDSAQSFTTLITRLRQSEAESAYLCHFMNSEIGQKFFSQSQIGGAQKNVNAGTLRKMPIPLPKTGEQRAIAQVLSDVDALLSAHDQMIAKKRDLKQAAMQQLLTGETRLPGFIDAWKMQTFDEIVESFVGGGTPSRANKAYWGDEIPWVTVKDFSTFNPRQSQEYITKIGFINSASNLIPKGTLITSTRMALGKAVVYEVDVAINQDLKALCFKPEVCVAFMCCWFYFFGKVIDELGSGSTVKGVSIGELKRLKIFLPPEKEQIAIAETISDLDADLSILEVRREKINNIKISMMQELLTGKTRLIANEENHV